MAEKDKITQTKIKRVGIFHFKDVYQFIYNWFIQEDYDVDEDKYTETVDGDSKTLEIKWTATKKISDYFKNEMKLVWRILRMTNVEVEKDGRKVKMNQGAFQVKITGSLIKDYEGRWDASPIMKFLRGVYDRYIIEGRIERYQIKLFSGVEELAEEIKGFLTIEGMK